MNTLDQALTVVFVLALAAGCVWMLRRRSSFPRGWPTRRTRRGAHLEVVERLALTGQHGLCLVRAADRAVLVAVHGTGCVPLGSWPWVSTTRADEPKPSAVDAGAGH